MEAPRIYDIFWVNFQAFPFQGPSQFWGSQLQARSHVAGKMEALRPAELAKTPAALVGQPLNSLVLSREWGNDLPVVQHKPVAEVSH